MISDLNACPCCGDNLYTPYTNKVNTISLVLGNPNIILHIKQCKNKACNFIVYPEEYLELSPLKSQYSFDTQIEIGILRLKNYQDKDIAKILLEKYGVYIPLSSISHLANKFIDYFAASHYTTNNEKIRAYIEKSGGYILHIDGTCEAGTPFYFLVIDAISGIILSTHKMEKENKDSIRALLRECLENYGEPLAIVSDLCSKIKLASKDIFEESIPHLICQYHLLENIGDKIFKKDNCQLRSLLKQEKLRGSLGSLLKTVGNNNVGNILEQKDLIALLNNPCKIIKNKDSISIMRSITLTILKWFLDYKVELNGEYYPFAKSEFQLVKRYSIIHKLLKSHIDKENEGIVDYKNKFKYKYSSLQTLFEKLDAFFAKEDVNKCITNLENGDIIFNEVRSYFRMQSEVGKPLSRLKISSDIEMPEGQIPSDKFIEQLIEKYKGRTEFNTAIKVIKSYFKKYDKSLSGHLIIDKNDKYINVYRTNNLLEHFFGEYKRNLRKRVGNWNLKRQITYLNPKAMLVINLLNEKYLEIIGCNDIRELSKSFVNLTLKANDYKRDREKKNSSTNHVPKKILRSKTIIMHIKFLLKKQANILFKQLKTG